MLFYIDKLGYIHSFIFNIIGSTLYSIMCDLYLNFTNSFHFNFEIGDYYFFEFN